MKILVLLVAALVQRWLFVSDIHLDPFASGNAMHDYDPGDTPETLWQSSLREMRARDSGAPVIVLGGDMLAHNFAALAKRNGANPEKAALATAQHIAGGLNAAFPRAQFVVALGNNDDPCGDYRSEVGGAYQRALANVWKPLVDRNGAVPDFTDRFTNGGYYTVPLPHSALRAIVLNSVLWSFVYRGSCNASSRNPGAAEIAWLARAIRNSGARRNVAVMHIPLGYDARSTTAAHRFVAVPFLNGPANRALLAAFASPQSHVAFALAAHVHRYEFRVAGAVPLLVASSISPVYRNNPAFFELDVDQRGTLRDVIPYTYDLRDGAWNVEPSFDATFGTKSFTVPELEAASARIAKESSARQSWMEAYDVWSWRMGDIADHRWRVFWCAQTEQDSGYAECAGTESRFAALVAAAGIACALVAVAIVLLVRRSFSERR